MATALEILENGYDSAVSAIGGFASNLTTSEVAIGSAVAGAVAGAGITAVALSGNGKSKKKRKRITHTKRGWKLDRAKRSKQKWEVAYQKKKAKKKRKTRKSKRVRAKKRSRSNSTRRKKVYYARKTGQPYRLLRSGKARFIKGKRRKK